MDNLNNIHVQKYIHRIDSGVTSSSDIFPFVKAHKKYSYFIKDKIIDILSIADILFGKLSEILEVIYGVHIPKERICELFEEHVRLKIYNNVQKIQEDIRNGKIQLIGVICYDEQYLWVKHQKYVRLTIIDAGSRAILQDMVIPNDEFNRHFLKKFLKDSINGLDIDTIVTDGHRMYSSIIEDLGLEHQIYVFHKMKNLMDKLTPIHNKLKRNIKN